PASASSRAAATATSPTTAGAAPAASPTTGAVATGSPTGAAAVASPAAAGLPAVGIYDAFASYLPLPYAASQGLASGVALQARGIGLDAEDLEEAERYARL